MVEKTYRIRDQKHLKFIRSLPCVSCGFTPSQAAHIRKGTDGGASLKPSDRFTAPLCHACHNKQHSVGEVTFWNMFGGVDKAIDLAVVLYDNTGNTDQAIREILRFKCNS
jgi:hypothetical protein